MRKRRNKRNHSPVARTKKTDWERSNAAHSRLRRKANNEYSNAFNKDDEKGMVKAWIKSRYHADVSEEQNKLKRKLTEQEKKSCYKFAVWVEDKTRFKTEQVIDTSKKKPNKKNKFRPQFRRGRKVNAGHPVYVYDKKEGKYLYIGLTHSAITQGMRNIELERNPNPNDDRKAYARPKTETTSEKLQTRYTNWNFTEKDKKKIKGIIKNNKKK